MSIATKTGDAGATGLLFNRRVPKDHPRVEAYGTCDELNAALGMAKALLSRSGVKDASQLRVQLEEIQRDLVVLMGELATLEGDKERYLGKGHRFIHDTDVDRLTAWVHAIEKEKIQFEGWATPGACVESAALDVARVVCRRAERRVVALGKEARDSNPALIRYLNRLGDLLWLLARKVETFLEKPR